MATSIGYARVSTHDQDLAAQLDELKSVGCHVIRSEKQSGASREGRSELQIVLDFLRQGDVVTVVRLDRLGRDTRDVLNIVHEIEEKGASLRVLHPPIDTSGSTGRIVLTVLGMVGEMERQFIRERQRAGIAAAKAKGVYKGAKRRIDLDEVNRLRREGKRIADICQVFGVTRQAIYKAIKEPTTKNQNL